MIDFRDVDEAKQVRLDLGTKVPEFRVLEGADVAIAGVIDEHVEGAQRLDRRIDRVARRLLVGHVERKRPNPVAIPIDQECRQAYPSAFAGRLRPSLRLTRSDATSSGFPRRRRWRYPGRPPVARARPRAS